MTLFFSIIRLVTSILMPIGAIVLSYLTIRQAKQGHGDLPANGQVCHRCGHSRDGALGEFHYTESVGSPRQQMAKGQSILKESSILGSESHFICDHCAQRYLWFEILQHVLVVLPYPLYLYVIIPLFLNSGTFANFLIETLLLLFSLAGAASAWDLHRAVRMGETPLAEARDRVAIRERKSKMGKDFSYFTRTAMRYVKKSSND